MKAIDSIRTALNLGDFAMMMLIDDIKDAPLTAPTPRGGNHPLWVLGHITFIEANLPHVLFGEPNPLASWAPLFAPGSEPKPDGADCPSIEEVIRTYRDLRAKNIQMLEQIGEAGLDRPTVAPPKGLEDIMKTFGEAFLVMALHQMSHRGQIADSRRALGRAPLFTPGV
jgi:hypothetical protein